MTRTRMSKLKTCHHQWRGLIMIIWGALYLWWLVIVLLYILRWLDCTLPLKKGKWEILGGWIALLGSYRIWIARYSQEWSGGELIRWSNNWRRTTTSFSISSNHIFSYCDQYPMYLYLQPVAWASKSPLETFQLPGLQVVWLCRVVMCPWQWIQSNMSSWIIY